MANFFQPEINNKGKVMKISTIAKYVDQPVVLNGLQKKMPVLLIGGGSAFGLYDVYKHRKGKKSDEKRALKSAIVIGSTIAASIIGTRGLKVGGKQIFEGLMENKPLKEILKEQTAAVNKFIKNSGTKDQKVLSILEKSKKGKLKVKEIDTLIQKIPDSKHKNELFEVILPKPENVDSHEIFSEIKRLSLLGLVPVAGGIAGGLAADKITGSSSKKSVANKIKEGFYQYFANIFLCNVGAGAALYGAEKLQSAKIIKPLSPVKKMGVILAGITTTGIVGGSFIANYLSKKIIDPLFGQKEKHKKLYDERKPEMLDIALHIDDIATAGVLSGLKWIEPALPFLYSISGYRAGIGYRNGEKHHH